ncbi:MAG: protein-L-isoaspartate O-methyltransferase [Gammaproteobacteria bacterium]|nr:protein-L-isoaspartate O-methyltransferase [Gammaproteobacteria bacterium]MCP5458647.1 protein-L-isoaspartate O-methyltransferase [Gammaproteobacteria bacterium]
MSALNVEQARFNMIEQQIRPWEVLDQRVLDVLSGTPREDFVPSRYRNLAFADVPIPLGHGQMMMHPNLEGRLLQALNPRPDDSILEIGTGSGYLCACLAKLGARVTSVEIFTDFTDAARQRLDDHGLAEVRLENGDAAKGWGEQHYDVIALTASLPHLTPPWHEQLNLGGRLFVVVGEAPIMEALLITRTGEQEWLRQSLFDTQLPPMITGSPKKIFEF